MEYVDLVNKIVDAEYSAQSIAKEALEKQESLDADLARDMSQMREDFFSRAKHRIDLVEETEQAAAREGIAAWDKKLSHAMSEIEGSYAKNRDAWIDTLFGRIIGQ